MSVPIILASSSSIRATLLRNAAVPFDVQPARVDEDSLKAAMLAEGAKPRDIADALAEQKARKVSLKNPGALVLGCDQVLEFDGKLLSKPSDEQDAVDRLLQMSGQTHRLFSAAVMYQGGQPVWRHIGKVTLTMRPCSPAYVTAYVQRNWDEIRWSVGAYTLEQEGVRLFASVDGDYFNVLGMPLLEILNYLTLKGVLDA